ncbi:protein MIS12 homolog [Palaemon carinicauda]|uniref:protein MIS12 homolog n=1 Tax=Palaemon carinicauda TaxID=392227 RepID=UPI0035B66C73
MASNNSANNEEYETQLFEFSPSAFFEAVKGIVIERLCEGIDQLEEQLVKVPESILPKEEVAQGITSLRQHTDSNATKTIQKLENIVLGTLMKIPPHILLPSDMEQVAQVSAADITLLQAEIDSLHIRLKNEKYMQARYEEELQEIHEVLEQQKKLKDTILSRPQIKSAEDIKEKLLFIQANEADIKLASSKAKEAFRNTSLKCIPGPADLFSKNLI